MYMYSGLCVPYGVLSPGFGLGTGLGGGRRDMVVGRAEKGWISHRGSNVVHVNT